MKSPISRPRLDLIANALLRIMNCLGQGVRVRSVFASFVVSSLLPLLFYGARVWGVFLSFDAFVV